MTVLVTGGGGYIGSHAVKRILLDDHNVVVIDNFSEGFREPLERLQSYGNLVVIEGDITREDDVEHIFLQNKIDAVMHFAALCSVDESMKDPGSYFDTNVLGTLRICEAMKRHDVAQLIFSSTCAVYGSTTSVPVDEQHDIAPMSPYAESKHMAEKIIGWYGERFGLRSVILRYFNVCGSDSEGIIGDGKIPAKLLVQSAVRGALGLQKFTLTYPEVSTRDGSTVRDYINVEDLIEAHLLALRYLESGGASTICNIGTEKGYSVLEVVNAVERELGVTIERAVGETREGDLPEIYADSSRAKELLGWQAKRTLSESIRSLYRWYTNHSDGYGH